MYSSGNKSFLHFLLTLRWRVCESMLQSRIVLGKWENVCIHIESILKKRVNKRGMIIPSYNIPSIKRKVYILYYTQSTQYNIAPSTQPLRATLNAAPHHHHLTFDRRESTVENKCI